jgi:hypothetical protein
MIIHLNLQKESSPKLPSSTLMKAKPDTANQNLEPIRTQFSSQIKQLKTN